MTASRAAAAARSQPIAAPGGSPELPHVRAFVAELAAAGLRNVCIAPGARSTPLTVSFAREPRLKCWSHVDERSAAFFALGVARATRSPCAIVCTSGTAAANFFPAIVEAAHAGVPLIVLTADRPPELRDCEAGQTIDQIKLYGGYAKWFAEAGMADCGLPHFRTIARRAMREAADAPAGVVHLNFPLREPLVANQNAGDGGSRDAATVEAAPTATVVVTGGAPRPKAEDVERLAARVAATPRGVILCGPADHTERSAAAIDALAARIGYPILADPTSQLRRRRHTAEVIDCYDSLIAGEALALDLTPDLVLRFGGLPLCKALRLWLERAAVPHVVIDPSGRWNDPSGTAAEIWRTDIDATCVALLNATENSETGDSEWSKSWGSANRRARTEKDATVAATASLSGVGLFARLARHMPDRSVLYVGNSLPIRQLEAVWPAFANDVRVLCNRGANGIDGVVSSILGAAAVSTEPVVGVLGDLSFYHDLNGLLATKRHRIDATIVVLNNDGGGIFSMLPQSQLGPIFEEYFTTPHGLDFRHAADLYGCAFDRVESWRDFDAAFAHALASPGTNIIEVPIETGEDIAMTRRVIDAAAKAAETGARGEG